MKMNEILKEYEDIVEKICIKYGYNSQDKEGNDSLKTVLLKVLPAMLKNSKKEERELFYQMLNNTPIVIVDNLTQEGYNEMLEQYIGNYINRSIIEEDVDLGEYGKDLGVGAYVSEPILDDNMTLQGKKSFIYIQRVSGEQKKFFGTDINVAHLIHELGHAWHSEKEQFTMQDDGTLKERVGTAEFIYSFSKTENNKFIMKCENTTGLMIEESMNTVFEETAMANYMNLPLEDMKKAYTNSLIPSNYQGYMADLVRYMLEQLGENDFENYRLYGDTESKNKINSLMSKTEYWKNRKEDTLSSDSPRNYDKKRAIINRIDNTRVQDFFKQYETTYFPDISRMTPMEKIDNVLYQRFNLSMIRYNMGIDNYKDFLNILGYEGYSLINQTADLAKSNTIERKKEITPLQVLKNALLKGTSRDKTNEAVRQEFAERNLDSIREEETKDD